MSQTVLMIWLLTTNPWKQTVAVTRGVVDYFEFFHNARNNFVSISYSYIRKLQVSGVFKHVFKRLGVFRLVKTR